MAEKVLANNYFKGNFVTNGMANNIGKMNVVAVAFLPMAVSGQVFTPLGQQYLYFLLLLLFHFSNFFCPKTNINQHFSYVSKSTFLYKLYRCAEFRKYDATQMVGAQWLSGRVLDSRLKGRGLEPHRRHCIVVLEKDTFILA